MTFPLGKQKLVKNKQDNQIQSITLCSVYLFEKGIRNVQQLGNLFENFCVKSNLTGCKVTFNCKLQKTNWGSRMHYTCSPFPAPITNHGG